MTLNIDLDNSPNFVLRPGSKLNGTVRFSSTKDEPIASVTLVLSGRCKVKIREHLHYTTRTFRSRGYYFYKKLELFDGGNFTHKAGDYAWPFSFDVPRYAEQNVVGPAPSRVKKQLDHNGIMKPVEDQSSRDYFPATPPWRGSNDRRPHPLPDTFATSQTKRSVDVDVKVEYVLIARLERPSKGSLLFRAKDIEILVDLFVKEPADPEAARGILSKMKVISDEKWISQTPGRSGSVKGMGWASHYALKPKHSNHDEAEQITFSVQYPIAVCASSTVPFILRAETTNPTKATARTIRASVVDLVVSIVAKTSARDDSQAATEHTADKIDQETLCWRTEQENIDLVLRYSPESGKLRDKVDLEDLIHAPPLVPSFSTYNIAREYFLGYDIKIRVFGEANTFVTLKESGLAVRVLPAGSDVLTKEFSQTLTPSTPPMSSSRDIPLSKEEEAEAERNAALGPPADDEALPAYEP